MRTRFARAARYVWFTTTASAAILAASVTPASAQAASLRIMPPDQTVLAAGQRFDLRVEATALSGRTPPRDLRVSIDGVDVTSRSVLDPGVDGVRGAGGTGASGSQLSPEERASPAPPHTANYLLRWHSFVRPGRHVIEARTADGAVARVTHLVERWQGTASGGRRARNIIFLLGDGMGLAHRTAARIVSRGLTAGKANGLLAMDSLEVTGQVMTSSLNAVVTDSAPGMSSYVTGSKAANGQEGVFPDNTTDPFDNPRIEYLGAMLRRVRGAGFNVGIVTTADLTDATPAANAVHTADRMAAPGIAQRFLDERQRNGVTVLLGGGARHFVPSGRAGSSRGDARDLVAEYRAAGYEVLTTAKEVKSALSARRPPKAVLGLFTPRHMSVAFDKVGVGRYSQELEHPENASLRDQPMLVDMARVALRTLDAHSPRGFYLMIEGASIDKQAHAVDAERSIWDTIEFDHAVGVAIEYARRTNADADPANDTLVVVTADHECGGFAILGSGNDRYAPERLGQAVRDYVPVRFGVTSDLDLFTNYELDAQGYPRDPDPSRKLLIGWAAAPDHYENWLSNRTARPPTVTARVNGGAQEVSVANPDRDGTSENSDNLSLKGQALPGFLVRGVIENGEHACGDTDQCPGDTSSSPQTSAGHTATDVVLSADGPGAWQFSGVYDNTDVFVKLLRAATGAWRSPQAH